MRSLSRTAARRLLVACAALALTGALIIVIADGLDDDGDPWWEAALHLGVALTAATCTYFFLRRSER